MTSNFENKPVAIVGMACRLPQANDLDQFWQLLYEGRCTATELPPDRLDRELHYDSEKSIRCKSYTTIGCLVDYDQPIDLSRVPLTQADIDGSDISHTTMAAVAAEAFRHAGMDPFNVPAALRHAGVYIGHVKGSELGGGIIFSNLIEQTAEYIREIDGIDQLTSNATDDVVGEIVKRIRGQFPSRKANGDPNLNGYHCAELVSKSLQLDGPFMVVNSACASSLQALAIGVRQLQLGHVDMAFVGGASYCKFDSLVMFSQAQSVSATGTRPFDADADGLVNGEGYIGFVLKTLDRARADGDDIHAVVRGIGISCDGRGKSLWAPKKEGQIEAMSRAYGRGMDVTRLQFVEAHATSTQVGDQTELASLAATLTDRLPPGVKIPIGSVKGNIGHTIETAGVAGILKTVLAMKHATIPPAANVKKLNPEIDWDNMPLYVPLEPTPWPAPEDGYPRRAAVNSFGIGGLNVHVVLDDGPTPEEAASKPSASTAIVKQEPIAIVGMGAVFPGARTIQAFGDMIRSTADPKSVLPEGRWNANILHEPGTTSVFRSPNIHGGFITDFEYDWRAHKVPPKQIANADLLQFMFLDAVDQAMKQAGYDQKEFSREKTAVFVGTITSGEFHEHLQMGLRIPEVQQALKDILRDRGVAEDGIQKVVDGYSKALISHMPAILDETGSYTSNTLASRITKAFDLMGGGAAIDAGGASGAATLTMCMDLLQSHDCDMIVCTSGQRSMGFSAYQWYSLRGQLAADKPASPFDERASGFVPGEGAGVFLLKRLADAQRDGDKVYGVIRAAGASRADAFDVAMSTAIERCYERCDVDRADVAFVESAAQGLPELDSKEIAALKKAYGQSRRHPLLVGAVSSQLGYSGSASLAASLLKTVHELDDVRAIGNMHLNRPAGFIESNASEIQTPASATDLVVDSADGRLFAGVNSSCGELAYHFVVERGEKVPEEKRTKTPVVAVPTETSPGPASSPSPSSASSSAPSLVARTGHGSPGTTSSPANASQPETGACPDLGAFRIVRLSGNSLDDLVAKVKSLGDEAYGQADGTVFAATDAYRLAMVIESADELKTKVKLVGAMLPRGEDSRVALEEKGVFWRKFTGGRPKVAFMFPGHGSQYQGMLKELTGDYAPARLAMSRVDSILQSLGHPPFSTIAWDEGERLGVDVWRTQLALLCADMIVYATLQSLGVQPDRTAGHSFGEFPALAAAGAWTFEAAVRATHARCTAIENSPEAVGIMMSVGTTQDVIERLGKDFNGQITVSVRNAPDQIVVGGDETSVRALGERLQREDIFTRVLPAPRPFHTPLMSPVKQPFRQALDRIELQPPRVPLLSSVSNTYAGDPGEIRDNLVEQMTEPVHWDGLVDRLHRDGVTVFVESGPHQILTKLQRRLLDGRDVVIIGSDQPKRNALRQLAGVRACLECAGVFESERDVVDQLFAMPARDTADAANSAGTRGSANAAATPQPTPTLSADLMHRLHIVTLSGSPYEMGLAHGRQHASEIKSVLHRYADLSGVPWQRLPVVSDEAEEADVYFSNEDLDELRGIADGAGVVLENIIAHNLILVPDMGAGCSHFAFSANVNPHIGMLHGTNEDQPLSLSVRDCLTRNVQVRFPSQGHAHVVFGVCGQLAGLNGMNDSGLTVSSAMLLDLPRRAETAHGRVHTTIVKRVLQDAGSIDQAVAVAENNCGSGAWSLCVTDHHRDEICLLEYDGRQMKVERQQPKLLAANHSRLHQSVVKAPNHSQNRLARLLDLFNDESKPVTIERAKSALRDRYDMARGRETEHPTMNTIRRVDNQISVVMQPSTGNAWVTNGESEDEYFELNVNDLLSQRVAAAPAVDAPATLDLRTLLTGDDAERALTSGIGPDPSSDAICHRFVMRVVEVAMPDERAVRTAGSVAILGSNPVADALRKQLDQAGCDVHLITSGDDIGASIASLETAWNAAPIRHLFDVTAFDDDGETDLSDTGWQPSRIAGASVPFMVAQRWVQLAVKADVLADCSIAVATRLGGDFGFSGEAHGVAGGALAGLAKSLNIELGIKTKGSFRAKVVDSDAGRTANRVAADLVRELFLAEDREVEIGYRQDCRLVVRPIVGAINSDVAAGDVAAGGTWVITGGARGVTAVVARELGKKFDLDLHLVGSSPLPAVEESWRNMTPEQTKQLRSQVMKDAVANKQVPVSAWARVEKAIEIDKNLRELEAAGVRFTYHACDITDRSKLAALLDEIRKNAGPIQGIVHGAGFESALRFEKKKRELVETTLAVKVDGAANLMELTAGDPITHFLAFGSVSGRFGGLGQADYATANDMLAKLVGWYRGHRGCKATTFHWHAWDEVGMAVRPESSHLRDIGNVKYMPTREGTAHLINEMLAGVPENEVLVTGWPFHKLNPEYATKLTGQKTVDQSSRPSVQAVRRPERPATGRPATGKPATGDSPVERTPVEADSIAATPARKTPLAPIAELPLIDRVAAFEPNASITTETDFDPVADPFLAQHRYKDRPLLPGVIAIATMTQAASLMATKSQRVSAVHQVELIEGLRFHTDRTEMARVVARQDGNRIRCELNSDFRNRHGKLIQPARVYQRAEIELTETVPLLRAHLPPLADGIAFRDAEYRTNVVLVHGPVFHGLQQVAIKGPYCWARINALNPQDLGGSRGGSDWLVAAAALDATFYACSVHVREHVASVANIPKSLDTLRLGRMPRVNEQLTAWLSCLEMDQDGAAYNVIVKGDNGDVVMILEGYRGVFVQRGGDP